MSTQQPPPGGDQNPDDQTSGLPSYGSSEASGGYPPPPPGGGYDAPGGYGAPQGNNTKALWSMITGILGVICCGPLAIVALVLANISRKEIAQTGQGGSGMATAGWWLGIIGIVLWVISFLLYATGVLTFDFNTQTQGF